jgi:hypothetical protein
MLREAEGLPRFRGSQMSDAAENRHVRMHRITFVDIHNQDGGN